MTGYQSKRVAAQDKLNDDDDTQVYQQAQPAQEPMAGEQFYLDIGNDIRFSQFADLIRADEREALAWAKYYTNPEIVMAP